MPFWYPQAPVWNYSTPFCDKISEGYNPFFAYNFFLSPSNWKEYSDFIEKWYVLGYRQIITCSVPFWNTFFDHHGQCFPSVYLFPVSCLKKNLPSFLKSNKLFSIDKFWLCIVAHHFVKCLLEIVAIVMTYFYALLLCVMKKFGSEKSPFEKATFW